MSSTVSPLIRLLRLLRNERSEISSIYFFAVLSGLIQLSLPLGIQSIVGYVMGGAMSTSLVILITVVVVGVAFNGVLQIKQMKLIERIQQKLFVRYSLAFASHIPKIDLQKADGVYLPELVNRFFDVPQLQKTVSKILLDFPIAVTQILLGLFLLTFYHPAFIAFGVLLILVLTGMFYLTGSKGIETSDAKSTYKYSVAAWLEELARAIKGFKFAPQTSLPSVRTDANVIGYIKASNAHFSILLFQYRVLIVFKVLITAAMLIVGVLLLLNQQINIGQFVAAEIVIILVINSVEKLITDLDNVYSSLTSVEKINKLLDKPVETSGTLMLMNEPVSIECRKVSFGYTESRTILHNVSFTVEKGQKVCLSGSNGTGKSTLLKLLTGAYANFDGKLLINGIPIGNYSLDSLRAHTGVVLNGEEIFPGTFWENITMSDENIDKNKVLQLCHQTGLDVFLSSSEKGFDTELDAVGRRLPRSVVKRILLVRALLHNPLLLLIEEPVEGIAEEDRMKIQNLLLSLSQTTVIAVTNDENFRAACHNIINITSN